MTIKFTKKFNKQLGKLPLRQQDKFWDRLDLWREDPTNSLLRVHKLKGKMADYYSIDITGDIRALYEIIGNEVYLYDLIGTHSQLYGWKDWFYCKGR